MELNIIISILFLFLTSCDETDSTEQASQLGMVVIDSVEYKIPDNWEGMKTDTLLIADPEKLVQLPQENTFEDYRIYLNRETRDAFVAMAEAAIKDSVILIVDSGYRSANFQKRIIKRRMEKGESFERVMRFVAPPGYSQHETGRAVDLVPSEVRFAKTKIYEWLQENAGKFGFAETYPEDIIPKSRWEPWHWYYGGEDDIEE